MYNSSSDQISHNYMNLALELAIKARGYTSPNPMVGCVIVKENQILATGYHQYYGGKHAEIDAIENYLSVHNDASGLIGSTLYVTLEPCYHYGKTPPCVEAILKYKIATVVIAMVDPNPLVAGKSIKLLQEHGIKVITGLGETQAGDINKGFISRVTKNRPYVLSKIAASLDGNVALNNGQSKWITNSQSRQDVMRLRAQADAIVTTASTVIADNPSMTARNLDNIGNIRQPLRVVIDKNLETDVSYQIYHNQNIAKTVLITSLNTEHNNSAKMNKIKAFKAQQIELKFFELDDQNKLNLADVWQFLAEAKGCNSILIEAGGKFNGYLLENNDNNKLVDQWIIYQAGCIMGDGAQSMFRIKRQDSMSELFKLKCEHIKQLDDNWRITLCSQE